MLTIPTIRKLGSRCIPLVAEIPERAGCGGNILIMDAFLWALTGNDYRREPKPLFGINELVRAMGMNAS